VLRFECKLRLASNGNYPSESSHSKETISANRVYLAASRKDELQLTLDWSIRSAGFNHSAGSETWNDRQKGG
jgi:hypothetical protein